MEEVWVGDSDLCGLNLNHPLEKISAILCPFQSPGTSESLISFSGWPTSKCWLIGNTQQNFAAVADFPKTRFTLGCLTAGGCRQGADVGLQLCVVALEGSKVGEKVAAGPVAQAHPFPKRFFRAAPSHQAAAKSLCNDTAGSWPVDIHPGRSCKLGFRGHLLTWAWEKHPRWWSWAFLIRMYFR